jgi:hypothetical protein
MPSTLVEELREFTAREKEIVYMVECIGAWDLELGLEVADTQQVTKLVQALYDKFGSVLEVVKVIPIIEYHKYGANPRSRGI